MRPFSQIKPSRAGKHEQGRVPQSPSCGNTKDFGQNYMNSHMDDSEIVVRRMLPRYLEDVFTAGYLRKLSKD